jgi:hypothetical protein
MKTWAMKSESWIVMVSGTCFAVSPALCIVSEELRKTAMYM